MGMDEDIQARIRDLLKRTGFLAAWKDVKDDVIKRNEIIQLAMEADEHKNKILDILYDQKGCCLWCKKKIIKSKEAVFLENNKIICRRCQSRRREIKKAHPDFKCECGAYLPLPENIKIWTKEKNGTWVCISCSQKWKYEAMKSITIEGRVFTPVNRWKPNGHNLFVARERAGLSVKKIAEYCGWTKYYQYNLEKANQGSDKQIYTIAAEAKIKLENAFVKFTGKTPEEWLKL